VVCSTYCEAPAKVSGGSRTLVCIKGFTFSHFSGKASAGAPDTRDDEAPPEKCKKYIFIRSPPDLYINNLRSGDFFFFFWRGKKNTPNTIVSQFVNLRSG